MTKAIDTLERYLGRFAIHKLTLVLVATQSLTFFLAMAKPVFVNDLFLVPSLVLQGEIWRIITFMIVPPTSNPIFAFFALYIFYFMGTALEENWGIARYNIYIFIAYIATIVATFLGPVLIASNLYIETSVFLAFAFLYPDFEFLLFFVLPVKVKYLAWLTWFFYGMELLGGGSSERMLIVASLCNFFLFLGPEILNRMKNKQRQKEYETKQNEIQVRALHTCAVCSITEKSDANMQFRVCSKCSQGEEYCTAHIGNHEHI